MTDHRQDVTAGLRHLGHVERTASGKWKAYGPDARRLPGGEHGSRAEAVAAVTKAAEGRP